MLKIALRAPVMNCCGSPTMHLNPIVPFWAPAANSACVMPSFASGDALLQVQVMDVRLHGGIQSQSGVNRKARKKSPLFEIARLLVPSGSAYQCHRKPESDSQFYAQFRAVTHSRRSASLWTTTLVAIVDW
jgi:hypothetical protein